METDVCFLLCLQMGQFKILWQTYWLLIMTSEYLIENSAIYERFKKFLELNVRLNYIRCIQYYKSIYYKTSIFQKQVLKRNLYISIHF